MGLTYTDETGVAKTVVMGCYGIGVTRCIAAAVEQGHDDNGIVLPPAIAPFHAIVIPVNDKNEEQMQLAEKIYEELKSKGIETLLDDRSERVGVKFKDADLVGIPLKIVVGKKCGEGIVEYKKRTDDAAVDMEISAAIDAACEYIKANL